LLTVRDLAERLQVTPTCVYRWLAEDRLPAVRFSRRCVRFREKDVEMVIQKLTNEGTTPERNKIR
jgi:excisionase family DNA binding protein